MESARRSLPCDNKRRNELESNGYWYREVVQRREGLRIHHAGRRGRRRVLPPHRHPVRRLPQPRRRSEGRVRRPAWPEGPAGGERSPLLVFASKTASSI